MAPNDTCEDLALGVDALPDEVLRPPWYGALPGLQRGWNSMLPQAYPPSERFPPNVTFGCKGGTVGMLCGQCERGTFWSPTAGVCSPCGPVSGSHGSIAGLAIGCMAVVGLILAVNHYSA